MRSVLQIHSPRPKTVTLRSSFIKVTRAGLEFSTEYVMRKRFVPIVFVVGALLFSAWSNVIAAAFCPRFASDNFSLKQSSRSAAPHHSTACARMGEMEMGDMQMEATSESSSTDSPGVQPENAFQETANSLGSSSPGAPCTHCISHSQSMPGPTSITAVDPVKRSFESTAPLSTTVALSASLTSTRLVHLDHGPPGEALPRGILSNVLRI